MDSPLKRGFSIAEVVVAIGLLAFSLLALVGVLTGIMKLSTQNENFDRAVSTSQELLDRIRHGPVKPPSTEHIFQGKVPDPKVSDFPPPPTELNASTNVVIEDNAKFLETTLTWKADPGSFMLQQEFL